MKKTNTMSKFSLDEKIVNSKLNIVKNFLYFFIAPLVIMIIAVILLNTVGFNLSSDLAGASRFKMYVNNNANLVDENIGSYDFNDKSKDDFEKVYEKIEIVLNKYDLKIVSSGISTMDIDEYAVEHGQAIEITFKNKKSDIKDIELVNQEVKKSLVNEFGYQNYELSVSDVDYVPSQASSSWMIGTTAAIVFALVAAIVYLAFRFNVSAILVSILQVALDIFMVLSLLLICRVPVGLSLGVILVATFVLSLINIIYFYNKVKDNVKSNLYGKVTHNELMNMTAKDSLSKKVIAYISMIIISIIFVSIAVPGVRYVALGIMLSLISTFYTTTFIMPTLVATTYKDKKKKIESK